MSNISRFVKAQEQDYTTALKEIQSGHKRSHWIWYIFPQIAGLGMSPTAQYYSIQDIDEAKEYYSNSYLRKNLLEISNALLDLDSNDAAEVMGWPDNMKLRSCMTLFSIVAPEETVFQKVLDKFYYGLPDDKTILLLQRVDNI